MVEYLEKLGKYPPSNKLTEEEKKEVIKLKKELQKFKEMDFADSNFSFDSSLNSESED